MLHALIKAKSHLFPLLQYMESIAPKVQQANLPLMLCDASCAETMYPVPTFGYANLATACSD